MLIRWINDWEPVPEGRHREYIGAELAWEVRNFPQHPLSGSSFRVVGARDRYNRFIVLLDDNCTYAYVHLTWKMESPLFQMIGDVVELNAFLAEPKLSL